MKEKSVEKMVKRLYALLLILWLWYCFGSAISTWLVRLRLPLAPATALLLFWALVLLVRCLFRLSREQRWKSFFITLLAGAALLLLPWGGWYEDIRFHLLRPQMEAAAEQIIAEYQQAEPPNFEIIALPEGKGHLSRYQGRVVYYPQTQVVYFVEYINRYHNHGGYLYFHDPQQGRESSDEGNYYYNHLLSIDEKGAQWERCTFN